MQVVFKTTSIQVIDEVQPVMKQPRIKDKQVWYTHDFTLFSLINTVNQTIYRARFSSITESAVLQAFRSLTAPNWNEARSVDARMELDLRIGCSFTRFQTKTFQVLTIVVKVH